MRKGTMRNRLFAAAVAAAAVALAAPASGVAGPPDVTTEPGDFCGIAGTWITRITNERETNSPSGATVEHFSGSFRFVSDATGKWIEFDATGMTKFNSTPVDNGDGTYSLVFVHSGSGIRIRTSDGGLSGPNYGAGHSIVQDVFDSATGEYITTIETRYGNRPPAPNGGDFCADVVIPALT